MRVLKRSPWLSGLGVLLGVLVGSAGVARADVTTDDSRGSIIIYPKVISDGTRDTLIQLSNSTNMVAFAHCFYINTAGRCSITTGQSCRVDTDCPGTEACNRGCNANNFDVILTAQQPLQWRASTGRLVSQTPPCRVGQTCACVVDAASGQLTCPGLEVGPTNAPLVPGAGTDFEGELKCYQTASDQATPLAGNALKGVAMLETLSSGQISQYNALGIQAHAALTGGVNTDNDLLLNFDASNGRCSVSGTSCVQPSDCPTGETCNAPNGEYNFCPHDVVFTHYGEGAIDSFTNASVTTELTLVPCTEMIEQRVPTPVNVSFFIFNEMEQRLSVDGFSFDCFFNGRLSQIDATAFAALSPAGQFLKTRVVPSSSNFCQTGDNRGETCDSDADCPNFVSTDGGQSLGCRPASGVLGVAEEFHRLPGACSVTTGTTCRVDTDCPALETCVPTRPDGTAAFNLHHEGSRVGTGGNGVPSGDIIVVPSLAP